MKFYSVFILTISILASLTLVSETAFAEWGSDTTGYDVHAPAQLISGKTPAHYPNNWDCDSYGSPLLSDQPAGCHVQTGYGRVIGTNYLARNGTAEVGEIRGMSSFTPIPHSNNLFARYGNSYTGYRLYLHRDMNSKIETSTEFATTYHQFDDSGGELLLTDVDELGARTSLYTSAFSASGAWMVTDAERHGFVRIDTSSGEGFYFGESFSDEAKIAISPDGNYVAVGSSRVLRLYNLTDCIPTLEREHHHTCAEIDLDNLLRSQGFSTMEMVELLRFQNNDALYAQIISRVLLDNSLRRDKLMVINADGSAEAGMEYLALGDSYASGEGAFAYKSGTDTRDNICHVSTHSYPFLLGSSLEMGSYDSIACSGAEIDDISFSPLSSYQGQVDKKIQRERSEEEINSILDSFSPGYINQSTFVQHYRPQNITVSASGNDIDFNGIVQKCVMAGTCYGSTEDRVELSQEIQRQIPRLEEAYNNLRRNAALDARVYAVGYPQVAAPEGNCGTNVRLNSDEVAFTTHLIAYLNQAVEIAADRAGIYYVDVADAFVGHKLCEDTASPAVNGLTAGNDIFELLRGPIGNESFHPTEFGNFLLQSKIIEQTENFSVQMPEPNPNRWFEDAATVQNLYDTSPYGYEDRLLRTTHHDSNITSDTSYHSDVLQITTNTKDYTLQPNTPYEVWLHSEPVFLATTITDENGRINTEVTVPDTIEPGYHSLKILGNDVVDQPVSIHKTIFIAEDEAYLAMPDPDDDEEDALNESIDAIVSCKNSTGPPQAPHKNKRDRSNTKNNKPEDGSMRRLLPCLRKADLTDRRAVAEVMLPEKLYKLLDAHPLFKEDR